MEKKSYYDQVQLINLRRDIHKHAETGYKEVRTSKKILEYLESIGIDTSKGRTGMTIDIAGRAKKSGQPFMIAFRSDMDALPIQEENNHLEYKSVNKEAAHMCGHDGHIAGLLGFVSKYMDYIDQVPSDKIIRLLFQPAEEGPGGAYPMIQEGCLEGVDEIYGAHNFPIIPLGCLLVKGGEVTAESTNISIVFIGKGGHGSVPELSIDPLQIAVDFHFQVRSLIKNYKDKGVKFACSMPVLHVGEARNAIADKAYLEGTLRSFNSDFTTEFKTKMQNLAENVAMAYHGKAEVKFLTKYPSTINSDEQAEIVRKVGIKVFGEKNVDSKGLPITASEDFSYFLRYRPGAFFMIGSAKEGIGALHSPQYDFNDECIDHLSTFWLKLAENRFGLNIDS